MSLSGSVYTVTFGGGSLHNTNVDKLQGDVSTATYGTVDRTISTTYDAADQITQESDPSATIDYTRDNLGRATSIVNTISGLTPTVTFDQTFSTGSDRTQLKAKISSTNDFKTDFSYDTLGRMTDIVQQGNSGNAVASKHLTLAYNKLGQFTSFNRYESTGTSSQVASTDFTYDTLNRLTDIDHKQGSTVLASYDYAYDFISRITSVNSSQDGITTYSYDADNQLTGADHTGQTDETYSFNANGSRTGSGYSVSTNNLTTSDGTYNYTYDDEGNRTQKTAISGGAYTTYSWDYRNRLTTVKDYSSASVLLKETTYNYDTHNRLVKSTYDADGAGAGAATPRYWAFDEGINPLLEFKGSSASDVSHRYLWGPAVDQLFADEQPTSTGSAGNVLWALGDNLGTIRDIADLSGSTTSVTNHRRFGAYGNLVSESNAAVDMLFAYTGKLYDENTKLQNNLFRWYDAATGQWMSEDPLGFAAADENVRRYVGNLAVASVDPLGLMELPLAFNDVADFMATMNTSNLGPSSSGSLLDNYCDTFRSIFGNALVDQSGGMIHSILTSTVMSDETLAHMSDGAVLAGTTAIAAALVLSRGQVVNVAGASLRLLNTPILRIPALTIPRFGSGGGRFALAGGGQLGQATTLTLFPAIPIDVGTAAVLTGIGIYMTGEVGPVRVVLHH